ncbi:MAG: polyphosphate polymerase domain-containing protein [Erysipelotrichaceae bacterium]|nr:polyphosphate polymerase domain-containing protein [Erysipelotrichaceae bacterium]
MAMQTVFKRYELKYMITLEQKENILEAMKPYMKLDKYGHTTIRNIYYDTDSYLLIRRSLDHSSYKEKLRIRSYEKTNADSTVFVELKRKYDHVVYKRRISLLEKEAMLWLNDKESFKKQTQIANEVDYFLSYYGNLHPVLFLSYEREAFYAKDGSDFRVTFDDTILCREEDLSLRSDVYGTEILPNKTVLMEIKCSGGIPIWMCHVLSQLNIYKTSFSKYGTAYKTMIFQRMIQEEA